MSDDGGDSRDGNGDRLPREQSQRIAALVERSAPAIDRPRVPDEYERQLYETDRKRAAMYASIEDLVDRCEQFTERLDELEVLAAVPTAIEDDEDSLVTTIAAATRRPVTSG